MRDLAATLIGKTVSLVLAFRPGGGHALPGLVIEKLFPHYVSSMLKKLPEGTVVITGTNGKTTTTKMVASILEANDKRVLTNPTGSNLVRGIASSLSKNASLGGRLKYDMAVLEVDEATARRLVGLVAPRWVLGLNVSRDQLDRFGEVDTVASYVKAAMEAATDGVVANAKDPHLAAIAGEIAAGRKVKVIYFDAAEKLDKYFPDDYELAAVGDKKAKVKRPKADVELTGFNTSTVQYRIGQEMCRAELKISGQHNFLNGAATLALCRKLLPSADPKLLVRQLSEVTLAFGRGEKYKLKNGAEVELVLVKNPASFTQALSSYGSKKQKLMIAINDNIADGRDVSWLWDVSFAPLRGREVVITSGSRAADMALRLSYEDIRTGQIEPQLIKALNNLSEMRGDKVILATYTAMLKLHAYLTSRQEKP